MKYSSKTLSQSLIQLCESHGVQHIVISPGSRSAPLTIGFTSHPFFKNYSIVDERCAAFFALGLAQQLKQPVALVCTSGSALLNYFPAIAEAFYSHIPLLVCSADRPLHLQEIGDGQTIQQEAVYGKHILFNANCKDGDAHQEANIFKIKEALHISISKKGPVHINLPFNEPLYDIVETATKIDNTPLPKVNLPSLTKTELIPFLDVWNQNQKKLVLVGVLDPHSIEKKWLDILAEDDSVIVLTETTSNLHHERYNPAIDQLIAPLDAQGLKKLAPEVLITFGGMIVSKKIKAFLRNHRPEHHWHIDQQRAYDTFFCLSKHFKVTPQHFFETFLPLVDKVTSDYNPYWSSVHQHRLQKRKLYIHRIPFSDFKVYALVFNALCHNTQLQLANSTAIRYAQLFDIHPSIEVFCNRGTSGIDGSTSTAIGAAVGSGLPTYFITGDLSFLYDSNALWNQYTPINFKIIVINNSGGGIFRILPKAKCAKDFEQFFETKHGLTAKHLAEMYGYIYITASTSEEVLQGMQQLNKTEGAPVLLEIFTSNKINEIQLLDYFRFIK